MAVGDLCTLAELKSYLVPAGSTATADDTLLNRLITAKSAQIARFLGRTIYASPASFTEVLNGTGTDQIMLRNWPLRAVTSVTVDGTLIPQGIPGTSGGWTFQGWSGNSPIPPAVIRLQGPWLPGVQGYVFPGQRYTFSQGNNNVQVVYSAGFDAVPEDIKQACIELVSQSYIQKDRLGQRSMSLGPQSVSLELNMLPSIKEVLMPYRRVSPIPS